MPPLLQLDEIDVFHGDLQAVFGVSLRVEAGEALALIGANGAGKSTLLRAITGLTPARRGTLCVDGQMLGSLSAERIAALGIALVPEGRQLFPSLSVEENLLMGTLVRRAGRWTLATVYELFPVLHEFRQRPATLLSGGQQQMVAIGRALMANPKLLLLDEPSMGIAPILVERIYETIAEINRQGTTILLVEQNANYALDVSKRAYVLETGKVAMSDTSDALRTNPEVQKAYLGT